MVLCQGIPIVANNNLRHSRHLFYIEVNCPGNTTYQTGHLLGIGSQCIQVFPEYFTHHILPCPRHQFVKTHLNGILKSGSDTRNFLQGLAHFFTQLIKRCSRRPLFFGFQYHHHITGLHRHGVGGYFATTNFGNYLFYFRKTRKQDVGRLLGRSDGGGQATAG